MLVCATGLLLAWAAPAGAANQTFFVQKSNPAANDMGACTAAALPCATIQGAVDKAKATAGNTVQVLANADGSTTDNYGAVNVNGANPIALVGAGTGTNGTQISVTGTSAGLDVSTASGVSNLRATSVNGPAIAGGNSNSVYSRVVATSTGSSGFNGVGAGGGSVFDSTLSGRFGASGAQRLVRCVVVGSVIGYSTSTGTDIFDSIVRSSSATPTGTGISIAGSQSSLVLRLRQVTVSGFATRVEAFSGIGTTTLQAVNSTFAGSSGTDLSIGLFPDTSPVSAELTTTNVSAARTTIIGGAQVTKIDPVDVPPGLTADGHLAPGSALIDRGTAGGPLAGDPFDALDVDGEPRSQGAARDVGADETLPVPPPAGPGSSPPAPGAAAAAAPDTAAQSPAEGLKSCADRVTVGKDGTVKLCEATNPPTASTTQTLTGALPSKLATAARKKKKARKPRVLTLGAGQTTVPAGQTVPVTVKLGAKAAKALAKKGSLKVQASIDARGADGQSATVKRSVTLKSAKKKRKKRKR